MRLEVVEIQYNLENLVFGSDEEKAMPIAISVCFPTSKQVLCCRHIQENVGNYLANKVGVRERDRGHILELLFGESSVVKQTTPYRWISGWQVCKRRQVFYLQRPVTYIN